MKRRLFLQGAAGAALLRIGPHSWAAGTVASPSRRKLIVVMLRGAVDGLNVVVPYGDPDYLRLRPDIAIARPGAEQGALDLDGYFGLHPALTSLKTLWTERKLGFVHAAGSPDATRSHFDAQDYMESGTPGRKTTHDGWMNRLLGILPGPTVPTRAISVGPGMPRILAGTAMASNIATGGAAAKPGLLDHPKVSRAFDQLYQGEDKYARTYREGRTAQREVRSSLEEEMRMADRGAPLPGGFPAEAAKLAALMRRDPNMQFAFVALGGWDTHANQGGATGQLANHLAPLGQGLLALTERLGSAHDDTVIVVMSEFGRTVRQNGNLGTDHGHGNAIWLLGGPVAGGKVHGAWPGLSDSSLHEGRDLPVTTDFRTVLAEVAERHLGMPDRHLSELFPGFGKNSRHLGLIRA